MEVRPKRAVGWYRVLLFTLWLLACGGGALTAQAVIQFDVFVGYEGVVPEVSWFPIVCEIKNDGPSFTGTVEVSDAGYNQGQSRRLVVELPTGTLKRVVIPVFSATRGLSRWDVQLVDERGKIRAGQTGLQPRKQTVPGAPLAGALSRTAGGVPVFQQILAQQSGLQPAAVRMLPAIFPDNPLVLEGLSCLYLNSEKAAELKASQVNAILAWLHAGGHLIVAVEQPSDIIAAPWLKNVFPCELKAMKGLARHPELQDWLRAADWSTNFSSASGYPYPGGQYPRNRNQSTSRSETIGNNPFSELPNDFGFEGAEMQVAVGELRDGRALVSSEAGPLIVSANRGQGRITTLLFSPEREPFRSWKNLPTFWAKLADVPGAWYVSSDINPPGGWSCDGIFGAMLDSRQIHKLPVGWLLLLLVVYLVVIGPLDQYWLKRIRRPMLTWITFPCYVVAFSLVIYLIGYKLRSGESEWNELHVVDVLQKGERAELRGRTYSSVYSPVNQKYSLESPEKYATLRSEFAGSYNGGVQSSEKATVLQNGDSFKAEVFVPVWTSQLFVSDWWHSAALPLTLSVQPQGEGWLVKVENRTDHKLTHLQVVLEGQIVSLGDLPAQDVKTVTVNRGEGLPLNHFVSNHGMNFQNAVQSRQRAFGASQSGRIDDLPNASMAGSFLSKLGQQQNYYSRFIAPPGLDLSAAVEHGSAVLLAWAPDFSPVKPMYQFTPRRSHRHTLWRLTVPVQPDKPAAGAAGASPSRTEGEGGETGRRRNGETAMLSTLNPQHSTRCHELYA